jgi:hypothetical protein
MARQVLSRSLLLLFTRNTSDLQRYHQLRDQPHPSIPTHTHNPPTHAPPLHIMWICCKDGTSNSAGTSCRRCGHRPCGSCDSINGFRSIRNFLRKLVN